MVPVRIMLDKINISGIIRDHLGTLRDYPQDKRSSVDFIVFFGTPAIMTGLLLKFYGGLEKDLITIVSTSLSIFAALLFNLLLLAYDLSRRTIGPNENPDGLRQRLIKEVISNISFAILVALVAIASVLAVVVMDCSEVATFALSGVVFFLVSLFFLTLLMLLKRVHVLLKGEVEKGA